MKFRKITTTVFLATTLAVGVLLIPSFIAAFGLTSPTSQQDNVAPNFQQRVDEFIKKHSADFVPVTETFHANGNDIQVMEDYSGVVQDRVVFRMKI